MAEPPDWRLQTTERALNRLERQGFAWEFLRRNPDYRRDYEAVRGTPGASPGAPLSPRSAPAQWGLRFPAGSRPLGERDRDLLAARVGRQRLVT
jgi:hypothetical protein